MTALTDATFYAPLKTTLVPTNGSGNPTFTRATTKTVEDNEGIVKTLTSGAVGLAGALVVQNLIAHPEAVCDVAKSYRTINLSVSLNNVDYLSPLGTSNVTKVTGTGAGLASFDCFPNDYTGDGTSINTFSLYFKLGSVGTLKLEMLPSTNTYVSVDTGTLVVSTSGPATGRVTPLPDGWYRIECTNIKRFYGYWTVFFDPAVSTTNSIYLWGCQLENVTGQAIQTAGDYVSVGVLANPYHGCGVDGVKYFDTDSGGAAIPDATMLGAQLDYASKTNSMLYCRDLTNAAWVKTNCTAAKTQTGVDGLANACSLLTATIADATCLQTITTASTPACTGWKVKRSVGTGSIYITRDNGSNYTDITSLINSGAFTLTGIENTSVLNPVVGFKIATSGDAIIVDSGRNHSGTELCEDIFTTSAPVTRNAEVLTYQTASNFSDTAGTILATIKRDNWGNGNGSAVGKASFGLLTSSANSGVQAADGTNTVSGAAGTPTGQRKIGARWTGSSLQAFYEDEYGAIGSYDGSFNLSTIAVMPGTQGYIRDLAIFNTSLADTDMPWYVAPIVVTATPAYGGGGSLPYSKTNKVPRPMATVMPNDDDEVLVVIQLFMESGCQ